MAVAERAAETAPGVRGLLQRRYAGVPVWAYAAAALALVLVIAYWRSRRGQADATAVSTGDDTELPGDQSAPPVFIMPQQPPPVVNVTLPPSPATVPPAPPGGGRTTPPGVPPKPTPPPRPPGLMVTVTKYTTHNPPWSSTLSGIFGHYKGTTTARTWQDIWNHPLNADLRRKRGAADRIVAGDKVFVPGAR